VEIRRALVADLGATGSLFETMGELRLALEITTGRAPRKLAIVRQDDKDGAKPVIENEVHQTSVREIAQVAAQWRGLANFCTFTRQGRPGRRGTADRCDLGRCRPRARPRPYGPADDRANEAEALARPRALHRKAS